MENNHIVREQHILDQQLTIDDLTTEYLDNLSRRLQLDTFNERGEGFRSAWERQFVQLEVAAIMFHDDGNDITLCTKLADGRCRGFEYELYQLKQYGEKLNQQIRSHVVTDPEITVVEHDQLVERRDRLRDQYVYLRHCFKTFRDKVRPEIAKRTGYTMDSYRPYDPNPTRTKHVRVAKGILTADMLREDPDRFKAIVSNLQAN